MVGEMPELEDHQKRLKGTFSHLLNNLEVKHADIQLLEFLIQEEVLNQDEYESILCKDTPRNATRRFLAYMFTKDRNAFDLMLEGLRDIHKIFVCEMLINYDTNLCPQEKGEIEKFVEQENGIETLQIKVEEQMAMILDLKKTLDQFMNSQKRTQEGDIPDSAQAKMNLPATGQFREYMDNQIEQLKTLSRRQSISDSIPPSPQILMFERKEVIKDPGFEYQNYESPSAITTKITSQMASHIIQFMTVGSNVDHPLDKYSETMQQTVLEILETYGDIFLDVMNQSIIKNPEEGLNTISKVADVLFFSDDEKLDEKMNWGRVIVLYAYVGWTGQLFLYSRRRNMSIDAILDNLSDYLSYYIDSKLSTWIKQNGGWDAFEQQYRKSRFRSGLDRALKLLKLR